MEITAENPVWANSGHTIINLIVKFPHLPDAVPFTASPNDPMDYGREIYANAAAGMYGPVAEYQAA